MSQRTEQVGDLLRQEISQIMIREIEPPKDCLITVSRADVTPDLRHAKVFISILPESKTGTALKLLNHKKSEIQKILHKRLVLKFVPQIHWQIDVTNIRYAAIDQALKD